MTQRQARAGFRLSLSLGIPVCDVSNEDLGVGLACVVEFRTFPVGDDHDQRAEPLERAFHAMVGTASSAASRHKTKTSCVYSSLHAEACDAVCTRSCNALVLSVCGTLADVMAVLGKQHRAVLSLLALFAPGVSSVELLYVSCALRPFDVSCFDRSRETCSAPLMLVHAAIRYTRAAAGPTAFPITAPSAVGLSTRGAMISVAPSECQS